MNKIQLPTQENLSWANEQVFINTDGAIQIAGMIMTLPTAPETAEIVRQGVAISLAHILDKFAYGYTKGLAQGVLVCREFSEIFEAEIGNKLEKSHNRGVEQACKYLATTADYYYREDEDL